MLLQSSPFDSANIIATIATGIVVGIVLFALDKAYTAYKKKKDAQNAQPKLAVKLEFMHRSRFNNGMSHSNNFGPGTVLNAGEMNKVIFYYQLNWQFALHITNQSENTAYRAKLIKPETKASFVIEPEVELNKPFLHSETKTFTTKFSMNFEGNHVQGDEILSKKPFEKLVIEYENSVGMKFLTEFYPNEPDEEKRNVYKAIA